MLNCRLKFATRNSKPVVEIKTTRNCYEYRWRSTLWEQHQNTCVKFKSANTGREDEISRASIQGGILGKINCNFSIYLLTFGLFSGQTQFYAFSNLLLGSKYTIHFFANDCNNLLWCKCGIFFNYILKFSSKICVLGIG